MQNPAKLEPVRSRHNGKWYVRLTYSNGLKSMRSQFYASRRNAVRAIAAIRRAMRRLR